MTPASRGRATALAAAGALCISASAVLMRLASAGAVATLCYRCGLALPALAALAVRERRRHGRQPWSRLGAAAGAGVFLGLDLLLWYRAISDVGAGVATVLGNLQVLFVAGFAWLALRERPPRLFVATLPVILAGVVAVSGMIGQPPQGTDPVGGIGYGIATSVAYAAFLLLLRRASAGSPHVAGPVTAATVGAAATGVVTGLAAAGLGVGGLGLAVSWPAFGWLALLAVSTQVVGWLVITSTLPHLPAALASGMLLLQPAAAVLLAAAVLAERHTAVQLAGAALICGGVITVSRIPWTSTVKE